MNTASTSEFGLIDSHCHLDYDYDPKKISDLISEALANQVTHLITVGTELPRIPNMVQISEKFENVFHTIGVHPHEASLMQDTDLNTLREACKHPKCVAIGETGLDYYYEHSKKEDQIKRLNDQLSIALEFKLPVVIHSRDAEGDLLPELRNYAKKICSTQTPGIIHCFTGTFEFAKKCIDLGFYISFSGILTFKNSEALRTSANQLPLERLLVETDSPFLAPVPLRGKKCEPYMVKHTAKALSEIKKISFEEVVKQTRLNTIAAFSLSI